MTAVDRVFMASPSHPLSIASHAVIRRSLPQRTQLSVNSSQRALSSLVFRRPPWEPTHLLRKIINIGRMHHQHAHTSDAVDTQCGARPRGSSTQKTTDRTDAGEDALKAALRLHHSAP
ncbi:hypothetical protein PINS_up024031 [Pythium insidiosum]|nr:hypothetical protein PINS_up024031 [Pythium insidiosum]